MKVLQEIALKFLLFTTGQISVRALMALAFVSLAAVGLDGVRVLFTGQWRWLFLAWNLALAWVPLFLALAACRVHQASPGNYWKLGAAGVTWLMFFPNAPYICTDLVHLTKSGPRLYWLDMILILLFALNGLVLGFVSLRLMHDLVTRQWGGLAGWLFAAGVAGLSGVGVYIGRFLRLNSWDALLNPFELLQAICVRPADLPAGRLKFSLLFAAFVLLSYLMLYALTELKPPQPLGEAEADEGGR